MKFLEFRMVRLDGKECKVVELGKVALAADNIMGFFDVPDNDDCEVQGIVMLKDKQGGQLMVKKSFAEMQELLSMEEFS